jgi:hypothetical protein
VMYDRCLPSFVMAGAFKSGTTSLYKYLSFHPEIATRTANQGEQEQTENVVSVKEIGFFLRRQYGYTNKDPSLVMAPTREEFHNKPIPGVTGAGKHNAHGGSGSASAQNRRMLLNASRGDDNEWAMQRGGEYEEVLTEFIEQLSETNEAFHDPMTRRKLLQRARRGPGGQGRQGSPGQREKNQKLQQQLMQMKSTYKFYFQAFPVIHPWENKQTGDATPAYLPSVSAPLLISEQMPWARVMMILREPIYRGFSRMSHIYDMRCDQYLNVIESTERLNKNRPGGAQQMPSADAVCNTTMQKPVYSVINRFMVTNAQDCADLHWDPDFELVQSWTKREVIAKFRMWSMCMQLSISQVSSHASNPRSEMSIAMESLTPEGKNLLRSSLQRSMFHHSMYAPQVWHWKQHFDEMLVLKAENLFEDGIALMQQVEAFLHLTPQPITFWEGIVGTKYNVGYHRGGEAVQPGAGFVPTKAVKSVHKMDSVARIKAEKLFHPFNVQLAQMVDGSSDTWWPYDQEAW